MDPAWLTNIKQQLEDHHRFIQSPFETIIDAYNEALHREEVIEDEKSTLEDQLKILKDKYNQAQEELTELKSEGSGTETRKYQELDARYKALKKEQVELLKTQSINSTRLLELNEQVKTHDRVKEKYEKEMASLAWDKAEYEKKIDYLEKLVQEKNFNIEVLQDELQALQLELIHTDERMKTLEVENRQLVDRWLSKVNQTVEQLNAEVETSRAVHQIKLSVKRVFSCSLPHDFQELEIHGNILIPIGSLRTDQISMYIVDLLGPSIKNCPNSLIVPQSLVGSNALSPIHSFSRDGDIFLASTKQQPDQLYVWKVSSGKVLSVLSSSSSSGSFVCLAPWSSTNDVIIALTETGKIKLFDIPRSFCLWTESAEPHTRQIITFNHDDLIAALSGDGRIILWDIRSRSIIKKSEPHLPCILRMHSAGDDFIFGFSERSLIAINKATLKQTSTTILPFLMTHSSLINANDSWVACASGHDIAIMKHNGAGSNTCVSEKFTLDSHIVSIHWISSNQILVGSHNSQVHILTVNHPQSH